MSLCATIPHVAFRHTGAMAKQTSGSAYDREVGQRIRAERNLRGWSQEKLTAKLPGGPVITGSQLAKKERGEEGIPIDLIRRIALAFDIPMLRLIDEPPRQTDLRAHGLASRIVALDASDVALFEQLIERVTTRRGRSKSNAA